MAMMTESESLIGQLHHTPQIGAMPSDWNNKGKPIIRGMRNNTCLVKLKNIALGAMPIEV
jgi:hypothetical protein